MGGLLEAFEQPMVAAIASALVILGFALAFVFFARSSRIRKARDERDQGEVE